MERRAATLQHGCFVGLSGGVDSGCIALRLVEMKVAHHIFSLSASEEVRIVQARHAWASREAAGLAVPHPVERLSRDSYAEQFAWFPQHVEAYAYTQPQRRIGLMNDAGAVGLSHICAQAKPLGVRVYLSGAGADEIHGNYGRVKQWPANLSEIWPWPAFFGHEMRDYLRKEEHVAGAHGIEGRFPYLDVDVVQEYLWLNTTLKATRQGAAARSKCRCSQQLMRPPSAPEADPLAQGCPLEPSGGTSPPRCRREAAAALWCCPDSSVSLRRTTQSRPGPGQASAPRLPSACRLPGRREEARLLGRELAGMEHQPHQAGEARRRGEPARKASGARRESWGRAGRDAHVPREACEHRVYTRLTCKSFS